MDNNRTLTKNNFQFFFKIGTKLLFLNKKSPFGEFWEKRTVFFFVFFCFCFSSSSSEFFFLVFFCSRRELSLLKMRKMGKKGKKETSIFVEMEEQVKD